MSSSALRNIRTIELTSRVPCPLLLRRDYSQLSAGRCLGACACCDACTDTGSASLSRLESTGRALATVPSLSVSLWSFGWKESCSTSPLWTWKGKRTWPLPGIGVCPGIHGVSIWPPSGGLGPESWLHLLLHFLITEMAAYMRDLDWAARSWL